MQSERDQVIDPVAPHVEGNVAQNPLIEEANLPLNGVDIERNMAKVANYRVALPIKLDADTKWSEWLPRFTDAVQANGWEAMLTDATKVEFWFQAKDMLLNCTEKNDHPRIRRCTNLKDAILALKDAHHVSTQVDMINLLRELNTLKLRPEESVRSVVARVELICENLLLCDKEVDEPAQVAHIINVLSQNPSYKMTLDQMLANSDNITKKSLMRGFNIMHARDSITPGAHQAEGMQSTLEKFMSSMNDKFEQGMANFAKKFERGGKGGRGFSRGRGGGRGFGGRGGGRGGNERYHPYNNAFPYECNNCGVKGHKAAICYKPCKRCGDSDHNIVSCPNKPRGNNNNNNHNFNGGRRGSFRGAHRGGRRGGYNNAPRANAAQGAAYEAAHRGGEDDDEDFLEGGYANMAHGMDLNNHPPGFGPHMTGPRTVEDHYGTAMNVMKYRKANLKHMWILDSGASHHMTPLKALLFDYVEDSPHYPMHVKVANNKWEMRAGVGKIRVHTKVNGHDMLRTIHDVWYMPSFDNSLLSSNQLKDMGHWIISTKPDDYVFDDLNRLWLCTTRVRGLNCPVWALRINTGGKGTLSEEPIDTSMPRDAIPPPDVFGGLAHFARSKELREHGHPTAPLIRDHFSRKARREGTPPPVGAPSAFSATGLNGTSVRPTDKETGELWHMRLAHMGMDSLQYLVRHKAIAGINIPIQELQLDPYHRCEVCVMAPHLKELPKPAEGYTIASTDLGGPYRIKTLNLCVYTMTFVEWSVRYTLLALLRHKSEACKELKRFIMMIENQLGKKLKYLFSDRGGEYIKEELGDWFAEKGIIHDYSVGHTPKQNGVAERMNQSLNNMVRAMMLQYKSYPPLWGEAMMYAVKIKNCSLHKTLGMTPYEAMFGRVPNIANFRTFGCLVYARVADCDRGKLDPKSVPGIYLGPEFSGPGYRVFVYKADYKRANKYVVQVFRDLVCYENLKAVTGANHITDLHWGGHIPLPTPIETSKKEMKHGRDRETQLSVHGARFPTGVKSLEFLKGKAPMVEHPVENPPLRIDTLEHTLVRDPWQAGPSHETRRALPTLTLGGGTNELAVNKQVGTNDHAMNKHELAANKQVRTHAVNKHVRAIARVDTIPEEPMGGGSGTPSQPELEVEKPSAFERLVNPVVNAPSGMRGRMMTRGMARGMSESANGSEKPMEGAPPRASNVPQSENVTRADARMKDNVPRAERAPEGAPPRASNVPQSENVTRANARMKDNVPRAERAPEAKPRTLIPPRKGGNQNTPITRIGAAMYSICGKRKRVSFDNTPCWVENNSEFKTMFENIERNFEFDPVGATAFTAHAPFDNPPPEHVLGRDELVEGLMKAFDVPKHLKGELPVLTEVDPTNPPKTLRQAMASKYAKYWALATVSEWLSIVGNNTWELVHKEPWMKIIPCKWVYVVKVNEKNIPVRFKARLVAGGHRQIEGIDYDETYAPVSRMTTLRILLALAASKGWIAHQLDISTAFLHGKADLDIYMRQPPGFEDGANLICKLKKTLYGLKQAPRAWFHVLKGILVELGFAQVSADSSFWIHKTIDIVAFLTSIVDDMLIVSPDEKFTLDIVHAILAKLPGTHSGRAKYYNGLRITWFDNTHQVLLTQAAHVEKLCAKFKHFMKGVKQRSLPAKETLRLCKTGSNFNLKSTPLDVEVYRYREVVGGLSYITHGTRPDALHITNQLAKMANNPMVEHWDIAMNLLSFMYHSRYWGVMYGGRDAKMQVNVITKPVDFPVPRLRRPLGGQSKEPMVVGFADANHGTGLDDKRSISGFVIKVLGGPVSWASRTQPLTAASTTESEYRALSECSREALWISKLLDAFDIPCLPFPIFGDSQGALGAIRNYSYTPHTKHIEIVHDFMKDRFQSGQLDYQYVSGEDNPADIFTKCLGGPKFAKFRTMLGMAELPPHLV
jgi:Reverse transcriptase (RNA-dependent DNA polymerase)/gag-polypeptide of LTR copia-type/GAG-pre-integrase domain